MRLLLLTFVSVLDPKICFLEKLKYGYYLPNQVLKLSEIFFWLKVQFAIQKKDSGKAVEQQTIVSSSTVERDLEIEELQDKCYSELLECCKTMAIAAGVNYATIINLQVCLRLVMS